MSRASRVGHLLGSRELADTPTEVILRGAVTKALVGGLAFVEPIRPMAAAAVNYI